MSRKAGNAAQNVAAAASATPPAAPTASANAQADFMGMLLNSANELGISPGDIPRLLSGDPEMLRDLGARLFEVNPDFRAQVEQMQAAAAQAPKASTVASAAPPKAQKAPAPSEVAAPADIKAATSAVFTRLSAAVKRYLGPGYSMNIQVHGDRIAMQVVESVREGRKSYQRPITEPTAAPPATSGAVIVSLISGVNRMLQEVEADRRAFEAAAEEEEEEGEYEEDEEDMDEGEEDEEGYEEEYDEE